MPGKKVSGRDQLSLPGVILLKVLYFCANFAYNISVKVVVTLDMNERLEALAAKHHGALKTADVVAAGISKKTLAEFVKERGYEKASHGIYCDPNAWTDSMFLLQLRCPKTIFSHDTALFLHDLTDREPLAYTVTARTGYNPSHLTKDGIKVYTVNKHTFKGLIRCPDQVLNTAFNILHRYHQRTNNDKSRFWFRICRYYIWNCLTSRAYSLSLLQSMT